MTLMAPPERASAEIFTRYSVVGVVGLGFVALELVLARLVIVEDRVVGVGHGGCGGGGGVARSVHWDDVVLDFPCFLCDR